MSQTIQRRDVLKALSLLGASTAVPGLLAACSTGAGGGGGGGATGGGGGNLDFWWNPSVESSDAMVTWMNDVIASFESANPGVTVETATQPPEQLAGNFRTACQAKSGPGLAHQYSGPYTMQFVWENCVAPMDGLVAEAELGHVLPPAALDLYKYDGKTWAMPWYNAPVVLMYNKALFSAAGLDPEKPPATFDELVTAGAALKKSGVTPWGYGLKGLTGIGNFSGLFNLQELDDPKELLPVVLGETPYTEAKYSQWLEWVQELIKAGVFNSDVTSLEYQDSMNMFLAKKSAIAITSSLTKFEAALGKDLGVFTPPVRGGGDMAGRISFNSHPLFITSFAEDKELAAKFLAHLHQPEALKGMYDSSGFFPADDRFDSSALKTEQDKQLFEFLRDRSTIGYQNYWPSKMDRENLFLGVQALFAGSESPAKAAAAIEQRLGTWRKSAAADLKNFEAWSSK